MATEIDSGVNVIRVSCIHSDEKLGTWWAIGTDKGWLEIRTTKAGKFRVFEPKKGKHPYFTIAPTPQKGKDNE